MKVDKPKEIKDGEIIKFETHQDKINNLAKGLIDSSESFVLITRDKKGKTYTIQHEFSKYDLIALFEIFKSKLIRGFYDED